MQLPEIIAFLLLLLQLQYDGVSSSHGSHFAEEFHDFQESLIKHIIENTALDPKEDNAEIEAIAKTILDEADRRLRKREQIKNHEEDDKRDNDKDDEHGDNNNAKQYLASDLYRNLLKLHDIYYPKSTDYDGTNDEDDGDNNHDGDNHTKGQFKREIDESQIEEFIDSARHKKQITKKEITKKNSIPKQNYRNSRKADAGDNNQNAAVEVDNTPNMQTKIINNAKHLFLEPNANVSKQENRTAYAHHRGKVVAPKKVVITNKVDRSGLDQFSFIAVVVACCVAGIAGIGLASFCWYKLRSETKDFKNGSSDFKSGSLRNSGYGKNKSAEEVKLARGAEVFHYLHAKKQIQQMEEPNMKSSDRGVSINESTDEEEEEEDTVYECPGLAPPGDMRVVNPLFSDGENHYSDTPSVQSTPTPPLEEK